MSKFRKILILELIVLALFALTYCNEKKKETDTSDSKYTLGQTHIEVSGSESAKPLFEKGLLLLHSFEYWDAADAFIEAQAEDPEMVMAYWGEAMTYNHGLWRGQNYEKGVAALNKLAGTREERAAKAQTGIEKDLLNSVEILYGEGTKFERDKAYSDYLEGLYEKYPGNQEVAAFYSLSLLGSVSEGRDDKIYEKGAKVAQGILEENPNHPGALHYLIHSYDDPYNAYKALEAANSYSVVAKDAGHALHMPSHIYVALGMWNEVVSSNEASYQASLDRMERKDLDNDARGYHAYHWLMYGYLQQGRYSDARQLLTNMNLYATEKPSRRARDYQIHMTGTYMVETGDWKDEYCQTEVDLESLNVSVRTMYAFIKGMNQFATNDLNGLEKTIDGITDDLKIAVGRMENRSVAGCSGSWKFEYPNQVDIDQAKVMQMELRALLADAKGQTETALKQLEMAISLEESVSYSYGPPVILKPSFELYGEWLLSQGDNEKAIELFEKSLERGPKRILSLKGLKNALEATGNNERAGEIEAELKELLKQSEQV